LAPQPQPQTLQAADLRLGGGDDDDYGDEKIGRKGEKEEMPLRVLGRFSKIGNSFCSLWVTAGPTLGKEHHLGRRDRL
jgi:hypothetical protein